MTHGEALVIDRERPLEPAVEAAAQHKNTACAMAAVAIQQDLVNPGTNFPPPPDHVPAQYTPDQWGKWQRDDEGNLYKTDAKGRRIDSTEDLFGMFLNDIAGFPVLTKDEERELAQQMEAGRALLDRLNGEAATNEAEKRITSVAQAAREKFIRCNLKLLASVATKLELPPGKGPIDLVSAAYPELERMVDTFDWRLGYKFSTRATTSLRWEMIHYLNTDHSSIHISGEAGDSYSANMRRALGDLDTLTPENLHVHWVTRPLSLHEPAVDAQDGSAQLVDLLRDRNDEGVEAEVLVQLRRDLVYEILDKLDPLERAVLMRYHMPQGTKKITQQSIADEFGFTSVDVAKKRIEKAIKSFRLLAERHPAGELLVPETSQATATASNPSAEAA